MHQLALVSASVSVTEPHNRRTILIEKLDQRTGRERRSDKDRRKTPIQQRFRKGCWIAFYRKYELEKFVPVSVNAKYKIEKSVPIEIGRYSYVHRVTGARGDPSRVFESALELVWGRIGGPEFVPIHLIEGISDVILAGYEIVPHDRRSGNERRTADTHPNLDQRRTRSGLSAARTNSEQIVDEATPGT